MRLEAVLDKRVRRHWLLGIDLDSLLLEEIFLRDLGKIAGRVRYMLLLPNISRKYLSELVTVDNAESLSIEGDVESVVKVLDGVVFAAGLGDTVTLDEDSLRDTAVLDWRLDDCNRIVFKVVEDVDPAEVVLFRRLVHSLLKVGSKAEALLGRSGKGWMGVREVRSGRPPQFLHFSIVPSCRTQRGRGQSLLPCR